MVVATPKLAAWCQEQLETAYVTPQQLGRHNEGMVPAVTEEIRSWCNQIRAFVDAAHEQDDVTQESGPLSELHHWQGRAAMANAVLEQVTDDSHRPMIDLMTHFQPSMARQYQEHVAQLTESYNEAKDNVKFLHTIEKFTSPLYHGVPIEAAETMPGLLNAIQIIYDISRFYNTPQSIQLLLEKINNQIKPRH